ncbi:hypothetical protein KPL37_09645 [Clostridium frigoris]|uniref:Uncharacterized protein n=1 Tax=Clostridium frigoris TaxID=205327 RepID=A0ABS6BVL4_9CLOT|nr:hypothetical protein [Clostridium frigoris]MBU3160014.1 hypothetical protein [Clostridium frigoris]
MPHNINVYNSEDSDKIQKDNAIEFLNNIAESHSIKDQLIKKRSENDSLENTSKGRSEKDKVEDNSDGTYKIINFL